MTNTSSLGRGLSSLIPQKNSGAAAVPSKNPPSSQAPPPLAAGASFTEQPTEEGKLFYISVDDITPNPHQPRTNFDESTLAELAASIKEHGVLQPVVVNEIEPGRYEIIMGERRLRAAQLAGLTSVPALFPPPHPPAKTEI